MFGSSKIFFVEISLPSKIFTVFLASMEDSIAGDCGKLL